MKSIQSILFALTMTVGPLAIVSQTPLPTPAQVVYADDERPGECRINTCVVIVHSGNRTIKRTDYYVRTSGGWVLQRSVEQVIPNQLLNN